MEHALVIANIGIIYLQYLIYIMPISAFKNHIITMYDLYNANIHKEQCMFHIGKQQCHSDIGNLQY